MLPVYVSYFAGGGERTKKNTLKNAFGFVLGFTCVFMLMGALAGTLGGLLSEHRVAVNIVSGLIVVFFGLNFLGVFRLNIFRGMKGSVAGKKLGFFSSLIFGAVFSVGWTPCVGAFLGSALMLASQQGKAFTGVVMLFVYSMGLGVPFVISALLIDRLKVAFDFIKRNYKIINAVCGGLLVVLGIFMMTGGVAKIIAIFE